MARAGVNRKKRKGFLTTIPATVRPDLRAAVRKGASIIVGAQRTLAPKDTGKLEKSIGYEMASDKARRRARGSDPDLTAVITADDPKAHLIEFGTAPHPQGGQFTGTQHPGTPPRGFFLPGYRAVRPALKQLMRKAIRDSVGKAVRKG